MSGLQIHPLTPDRWPDLERLFGPRGAQANCWCMFPRLSSKEFGAGQAGGNRQAFHRLVAEGPPPGLIAYRDDEPVGWVAVRPREEHLRIQRSRVTKPVDALPVWSVVCFVVARRARGSGVASALLEAAIEHARAGGAVALEGTRSSLPPIGRSTPSCGRVLPRCFAGPASKRWGAVRRPGR